MDPHEVARGVRREEAGRPALEGARHLRWGLSARLPRWHAFDGRRSLMTMHDGSPSVMATVARRARNTET